MSERTLPDLRHALPTLLAYGGLGFPLAVLGLPLLVYLPPFYAERIAGGTAAVGALLLVARLADVVSDPLIGWASDRLALGAWRRRLWMLAGMPCLLVGAWRLMRPPAEVGGGYLLAFSLLAYLGWTLIYLPYIAWGAELSPDYDERTRITVSREGFLALGTLLSIAVPAWIGLHGGGAGLTLAVLLDVLLVSLPVSALLLFRAVPEPPRLPVASGGGWRAGLALLAGNRPFRHLLGAYVLNGMANGLPAALFLFFVSDVLAARASVGLFLAAYFVAGVVTLPLWLKLSERFSKHRVWCASMLWNAAVFAFVPLLGRGDSIAFLSICVLSGASLGVDQALPASIQADVVDEDTAAGGAQRTGLYFGLWGMATKLAQALAVGVAYPVLGWAGFHPGLGNTPQALWVLSLLYAGLPVIIKLAVVPFVWRFSVDRARQATLRQRIAQTVSARR